MKQPLILLLILSLALPAWAAFKKVRVTTPFQSPRVSLAKTVPPLLSRRVPSQRRAKPQRSATTESVYQVLETQMLSVDYLELPLNLVIADLRDRLGINILVYWPSMILAGYSQDDLITLKLDDVRAETIVDAILNLASAGQPQKLGFEVDRGILAINLKQYLPEKETVVVYYVGDLMQKRSDAFDSDLGIGQSLGSSRQTNRDNN